ncbi:MAG TPA: ABC transporter ATP-binding protein [Candidatus Acidoferrales bacterium]|nr:ABC transporter ATP-binding protein [Candidatus Acidoferrales bacterium]
MRALTGANLRVAPAEIIGILGESGSGKSTLGRSVMQLLPATAAITRGKLEFEGQNLAALSSRQMQRLRGAEIALIPQEPGLALNPFLKVGKQIAEVLRVHKSWDWKRCCNEAEALLDLVKLESSERKVFDAYPHELSGGQQQRVAIAQAISCQPKLIVADEPTASLDHQTEAQVLELLHNLAKQRGAALLLITHNPPILETLADRVAVMYAGRVVEDGPASTVLQAPEHPYTRALMACVCREATTEKRKVGERFPSIPGSAPDPRSNWRGCAFLPRCAASLSQCAESSPMATKTGGALVECFLYEH